MRCQRENLVIRPAQSKNGLYRGLELDCIKRLSAGGTVPRHRNQYTVYFVSLHDIVMLIQGCTLQMLGNKILRKCLVQTSLSYQKLKKEKLEAT